MQIPSVILGTSPEQVESLYPAAVHDVDLLPPTGELELLVNGDNLASSGSNPSSSRRDESSQVRKRVKWSEEEEGLFVDGLRRFGKGRWKDISRHFVKTRTPAQVASHAEKFFLRPASKVAPSPTPPEQGRQAPLFSTDQANGEQTAPSLSSQSDHIEQQADHLVDPPSNPLGSSDQEQDSSNSTTLTPRQEAPLPDMDPTPGEKPEPDPDQDFFDFASSLPDITKLPSL